MGQDQPGSPPAAFTGVVVKEGHEEEEEIGGREDLEVLGGERNWKLYACTL